MKRIWFLMLVLTGTISFGETPQESPVNPAFIGWMRSHNRYATEPSSNDVKTLSSCMTVMSSPVKDVSAMPSVAATAAVNAKGLGHIPSRIDFSHLVTLRKAKVAQASVLMQGTALPSSYDLRTLGRLPAIRDQGSYGTCWAHAVLGSIESRLLTLGETFDFSEKHLANLHGRDNGFSEGGNADFGIGYLARLAGPIAESEDPYPDSSYYTAWNRKYNGNSRYIRELSVSKSPEGTPLKYALNVEQLSPMTDGYDTEALTAIKQAVVDYGAVYVSYTHVWGALDSKYVNFYWNGDSSVYDSRGGGGHAVQIVGWDDAYSKSNFKYTPPGDGAFIVKNSWGNMNAIGGYNYVSYHDAKFAKGELFSFQTAVPTSAYTGVYEYDPLGRVDSIGLGSDTAYAANLFTAKRAESLSAVGVYANAQNTAYTIEIYTGCSALNPTSGTKASTKSGTLACGYFTVPLETPVPVEAGERFSVVVKLTTSGYSYPLAVEYADGYYDYCVDPDGNYYDYYGYGDGFDAYVDEDGALYAHFYDDDSFCVLKGSYWYYTEYTWSDMTVHYLGLTTQAAANPGESFYSSNGSSWTDLTAYRDSANFCCKAYTTETIPEEEPEKESSPTDFTAEVSSSGDAVNLAWTHETPSAQFRIYRATSATRPASAHRTITGSTSYEDTTVVKGTTYYYWLTAQDSSADHLESDPVGPVTVTVPESGPVAKPDLAVSSFYATASYGGNTESASFAEGASVYFNLIAVNSGDAAVSDSFITRLSLYDSTGTLLEEHEMSHSGTVAAGVTASWRDISWSTIENLSPGAYRMHAALDVDQKIDESDRTNNGADVTFEIHSNIALATALDRPSAVVTTGGASAWYGCLSDEAVEGDSVARSGTLGLGESSWMRTEVMGAGVVSFYASHAGDGAFVFRVDGTEYALSSAWCGYSYDLSDDATHTIEWTFTASSASAYAQVDKLVWSENPPPDKPELSVLLRSGHPQYVALNYSCTGAAQVYSYFYRAESATATKTDFTKELDGADEVRDVSAEAGKVYWYWVCASNRYGTVWSDPVRAGWGLTELSEDEDVVVPVGGCETNFAGAVSWSAVTEASWLHLAYASSRKGEPISVTADANADGQERVGIVTVTFNSGESTETIRNYTVRQLWESTSDFEIEDGVLIGYNGSGGDIVIPSTVTNIASEVFKGKSKITSVVVPGTVRKISQEAFRNCTGLKRIELGEGVESLGSHAFHNCAVRKIVLPDSLCKIYSYAFGSCTALVQVDLGMGITSLPDRVFDRCSSLSSMSITNKVGDIGTYAFSQCTKLTDVVLSALITNIGNYAFNACSSLTNVSYLGNAPKVGATIYNSTAKSLVSHVSAISTGWNGTKGSLELPDKFPINGGDNARAIERANEWDTFPESPSDLKCVGDVEGLGVTLTWSAGPRAMTYNVYRATTDTRPETPIVNGVEECTFVDTTAEAGIDYFYWVSSVNNAGEAFSESASGRRVVAATLSTKAISFDSNGGEFKLSVNANADWTVETVDAWFEMSYAQSEGNGTITVSVPVNDGEAKNGSFTIRVGTATGHGVDYDVSVTQSAFTAEAVAVPIITPGHGATFQGDTCMVTITCATVDAEIYFTTDGKTPRPTTPFRYGGPFEIADTVEICAFAVKTGYQNSDFAEATITRIVPTEATLAGAIDLPNETIETDGDESWFGVADATATDGYSGRSGQIGADQTTRMRWTVSGRGTLTFKWRADCEHDPRDRYSYDYGAFSVDDAVTNRIDGTTGVWQTVELPVTGTGAHVFEWSYQKDGYDEASFSGQDCIWVDAVTWTPLDVAVDIGDKTISIPIEWFEQYGQELLTRTETTSYNDAAISKAPGSVGSGGKTAADGSDWLVWMDYVCGTNPLNSDSKFTATIEMVDGVPKIEWSPKLSAAETKLRNYLICGKKELGETSWTPVAEGHESEFNFFNVSVEMQ